MSLDFELPELPLEEQVAIDDTDDVVDTSGGCASYAFIGAGQGGGRIAASFYKLGYERVIVVNTAQRDLDTVNVPDTNKLLFRAGEQGAGKDMRVGEAAAANGQQRLYELMLKKFGRKVDHIFVCVGAGGGSGGGSTLVLIETAKKFLSYIGAPDVDERVGVIMALPTTGECASPQVAKNAKFLSEVMSRCSEERFISPLLIVDNDKIKKLYPNLTVKQFWDTVNDTVAGLFHVFNVIPTQSTEYTTFDQADYGSVIRSGGCMMMGVTSIKKVRDSRQVPAAIETNLERTLLADGFDLRTASHAAAIVVGGSNVFTKVKGLMNAIEESFDTLAIVTGNAVVHRGVYEDDKDRLNVYTMIGGLEPPYPRIETLGRFIDSGKKESKIANTIDRGDERMRFGNSLYDE